MMKMQICAIYDQQVRAYMQPFVVGRTRGECERSFRIACKDQQSMLRSSPEDYVLMWLAEFDDVSGAFDNAITGAAPVVTGLDAVASE